MTIESPPGKLPPFNSRHVYGPRAIGAVLPAVTRHAYRRQGVALGQLTSDWPVIIGPSLAAATVPRRLAAGTLTLGCIGPVALELQHLAAPVMERINTHLGRPAVQRLRFIQEAAAPRAEMPKPRPELPPIPVDGLPDGPLRDALARLGAALQSERA